MWTTYLPFQRFLNFDKILRAILENGRLKKADRIASLPIFVCAEKGMGEKMTRHRGHNHIGLHSSDSRIETV